MAAILFMFIFLVQGSCGAPKKYGANFSFDATANGTVRTEAVIRANNGRVTSDGKVVASGDVDGDIRGGVYHEAGGDIVGVNGGLHGKAGGAAEGVFHAEAGRNKNGTLIVAANSTLATTSYTGLTGHANLATGDAARKKIAEIEGKNYTASGHTGTEVDLIPMVSLVSDLIENFWLYFWLGIGCVVFIVSLCVCMVCMAYWNLISDVRSLKATVKQDRKHSVESDKHWKEDC